MSTTVTLVGAQGGHGASTVGAALAFHAAHDAPTAFLTHGPTAMARSSARPAHCQLQSTHSPPGHNSPSLA